MPMSSTSRYGLEPAPGGLVLLQDLVNTRPSPSYGGPDLLGSDPGAQSWWEETVGPWARARGTQVPRVQPGEPGRRALARLRDRVDSLLAGDPDALGEVAVTVRGLRAEPRGTGTAWLAGALAVAALEADDLSRLKTCRNRFCPCAFYDRSRNNSRVWHDVHTCGNAANLRASRARRRTP